MPSNTFYVDSPTLTALAAAARLVAGSIYDVNGVPFRAQTASTFVSQDGEAHTRVGYSGLLIGASTEARCHAETTIVASTVAITSGVITFRTTAAYPMRAGHPIRTASNNFPEVEGRWIVTSAVAESGGTRVIATNSQGLVLADVAAGHVTGSSTEMHDLQCFSATASYASMLSMLSGGQIRLQINATGGTILQDWVDPNRIATIKAFGRMDFLIIGPGIAGNALNANAQAADSALAAMNDLIQTFQGQFRKIYVADVTALTNEFGAGSGAGGSNTATFAAGVRYIAGLDYITSRFPSIIRVPVNSYITTVAGTTDTFDATNAFCAVRDKHDDGVHNLWSGAWAEAEAYWQVMKRDMPPRAPGVNVKPLSALISTTADPGGKKVQNLLEGQYGTVAATNVSGTGLVPNHSSGVITGLNSMSLVNSLVPSPNGGVDWLTTITSNGNVALTGSAFSQVYTGTTNSLVAQLNLVANQGVDLELKWDGGIYGFDEFTVSFVECVLEVDTGDGQGYIELAAGFGLNGNFGALSSTYTQAPYAGIKGAQRFGYHGLVSFPLFKVPVGTTYTLARIRQTARPATGLLVGQLVLRQGPRSSLKPLN